MHKNIINNQWIISNYCNIHKTTSFIWMAKPFCTRRKTHYETLNLLPTCTTKEVREAFISLSKKYHPDKNRGDANAEAKFVKINEAYNVLIKPESRRDYDMNLQRYGGTKSTNRGYYEVHRQQSYYRDPWKDPSFARNRGFSASDNNDYYHARGTKPINKLFSWLFMAFSVSLVIQLLIIRVARLKMANHSDKMSEQNRQYLLAAKERAEEYGTRERQIEEFERRVNIYNEQFK